MAKQIIDLDLIEMDCEVESKEEILQKLSDLLIKKGKVKESFKEAVLDREKTFPTGLKTRFISFALPHTDPEHVNETGVAVGVLKDRVKFSSMDNADNKIDVSVVVALAVKDKSKQVLVLQNLIEMMQDKDITNRLLKGRSKEDILEIFEERLFQERTN